MNSYISLFSGAGGLDLGLELAGWNCLYASDIDPIAVDTLNANKNFKATGRKRVFRDALIEQADIKALSGRDLLARVGRRRGAIPLLAGGPPCQSWSSAGKQRGFADPRGRLVDEYLRIASDIDARWLVFENVRGLLTARGEDGVPGSALASIRRELLQRGWQTSVELLNAADYGVPQRRVRLILLGFRSGDAPRLPAPIHSKDEARSAARWITLRDCLTRITPPVDEEVIRPTGKMSLDLAGLKPGTGAKSAGKRETTRPGGHWGYKQGAFIADPDLPARTVTASAQQDWIIDPNLGLRRLSPRECAAIQSFPADWVFCGSIADRYRLIGNAVPPLLARQIGRALLMQVKTAEVPNATSWDALAPLPSRLESAIAYTRKEELRNGPSRKRFGVERAIPGRAL